MIQNFKEKLGSDKHVVHIWLGYFLIYSDSKQKAENIKINSMCLELISKGAIKKEELLQGILVHMANYYDALIDYPLCEQYFYDFLAKLKEGNLYDSSSIEQLKEHAMNLKKKLDEEYTS